MRKKEVYSNILKAHSDIRKRKGISERKENVEWSENNVGDLHIFPIEIIILIASFLDFKDMYRFSQCSSMIRNIVCQTPIHYRVHGENDNSVKRSTYAQMCTFFNGRKRKENRIHEIQHSILNNTYNRYRDPTYKNSVTYTCVGILSGVILIVGPPPISAVFILKYLRLLAAVVFILNIIFQTNADLNSEEEKELQNDLSTNVRLL